MNIANILTILRIVASPFFIWLWLIDQFFAAAMVFVAGAVTDYYDGYLARKYGDVSRLGMFLDPIADKVLVLTALFVLAVCGYIQFWMVWIIAARDVLITIPRILGVMRGQVVHKVTGTAKAKTALQMTVINTIFFFIIIGRDRLVTRFTTFFAPVTDFMIRWYIFDALVFIMVVVTVYSGLGYVISHRRALLDPFKKTP
jgi:CDP-diacylglycerol--glycerol-3-phosphate 3-phosphatidyltransferase